MPDRIMIWSGTVCDDKHEYGVGLIMNERTSRALIGYEPVNDRILYAKFKGYPRNVSMVVVYAPTCQHTDEEVESFYNKIEEVFDELPKKDIKIILGDWNTKTACSNTGWKDVMEKYRTGKKN
jgi:hypothetical protein